MIKRLSSWLFLILIMAFSSFMVMGAREVSAGISEGISRCLNVIIPSLYGFLIISGFLVRSGLYSSMGKPFYIISKYIFHIKPEFFSVFILSQVGGYPLGAKLLADLVKSNEMSKKEAEDMMIFCYSGGPAFLAGAVGAAIFGTPEVGLYVFLSVFSTNIILALIVGWLKAVPDGSFNTKKKKSDISFSVLTDSVISAAKSLFVICAMIVFFSILLALIEKSGVLELISGYSENPDMLLAWLKALIEISNISEIPHDLYSALPLITAGISLGGLCILMQIITIVGGAFSLKKFFLIRPAAMVLSCIFMKIYMNMFAIGTLSLQCGERLAFTEASGALPSILLIIMTILLFAKKNVAKS